MCRDETQEETRENKLPVPPALGLLVGGQEGGPGSEQGWYSNAKRRRRGR